jgi:acetyltransferase-like isoleucine patch superfamily enzyme
MPRGGRQRPYLSPYDHAFANGPVFLRPKSLSAARSAFDRKEDGELLWRIFAAFDRCAAAGADLRLGLGARIVSKNVERTVTIGDDCTIRGMIRCESGGSVEVGNTVYIGDDVNISAQEHITIGDVTLIGHGVHVFDNDTHPTDPQAREAHFRAILASSDESRIVIEAKPIRIGRACWLGFNSCVMKGVTIGDGAIVAAHAVVVSDVPPGSVVAGNPAQIVKTLQPRSS